MEPTTESSGSDKSKALIFPEDIVDIYPKVATYVSIFPDKPINDPTFSEDSTASAVDETSILIHGRRTASLSYDWDNVVSSTESNKIRNVSRLIEGLIGQDCKHLGFVNIERSAYCFCTESVYTGQWNRIGMAGMGNFDFPHKVDYEGNLRDGMFHGEGTLTYPMGQKLDGEWVKGKLISFKFRFADGLEYDDPWKYCQMPDRRFFTCIQEGLRPAGRSLLTNNHPPREIPKGCYDTGDGFYNPATKCVWSAIKPNKILRVPTAAEEKWIMENCRKAWDEPTGYRPDLYEHWVTGRRSDSVFLEREDDEEPSTNSDHSSLNTSKDSVNIDTIVSPTYNMSPASSDSWWANNNFTLPIQNSEANE